MGLLKLSLYIVTEPSDFVAHADQFIYYLHLLRLQRFGISPLGLFAHTKAAFLKNIFILFFFVFFNYRLSKRLNTLFLGGFFRGSLIFADWKLSFHVNVLFFLFGDETCNIWLDFLDSFKSFQSA